MARSNLQFSSNIARLWKLAFIVYVLLLTTATHWPRLQLGTQEKPWPDKFLHMLAFGGLAFLFIQTRWVKRLSVCGLIAIAWTLFDEFSQSLPILGRTSSWGDALSGSMGVTIVVAWMWALGQLGGFANRLRLTQQRFLIHQLLTQKYNWWILLASAIGGAILLGAMVGLQFVFSSGSSLTDFELLVGRLVAGVIGAFAAIHVALTGMLHKYALIDNLKASCFVCAKSCKDVQFDDEGKSNCPKCEAQLFRGQWAEPMQLPISAMLKGAGLAAGVAVFLLSTIALTLYGLTFLHAKFDWVRQLNHAWQSWPDDMRIVIDLTTIALIVAIAVRIYRSRQARFYDRQDKFCRSCDHDLQGTPLEKGMGRCPECGVPFARFVT